MQNVCHNVCHKFISMATVNVILRTNRKNSNGDYPVCIRITKDRKSAYVHVGVFAAKDQFANSVIIKHPKSKIFNDIIRVALINAERRVNELIVSEKISNMTISDIVAYVRDDVSKANNITLSVLCDDYMPHLKNRNTISSVQTTIKWVEKFGGLIISDISARWLRDFETFLSQYDCKTNTIAVYMRNIRTLCNYAIDSEIIPLEKYPFRRYKIKREKTKPRVLTLEQLIDFRTRVVEGYQEEYRDVFMLIFYLCGINIIDLSKACAKDGYIEFQRTKTNVYTKIKIHPEAKKIIEKYSSDTCLVARLEKSYRDYNHRMNQGLQKIGTMKIVGRGGKKQIDPLYPDLTTYWARHTWATLMASIDAPDSVVSMGLSHVDSGMNAVYTQQDFDRLDKWNFILIEKLLTNKKIEG